MQCHRTAFGSGDLQIESPLVASRFSRGLFDVLEQSNIAVLIGHHRAAAMIYE